MVVLVTGANGQTGQALKSIASNYPELDFVFFGSDELDITDPQALAQVFRKYEFDFCINTAAYTMVDKAESDYERAFLVNVDGSKNVALCCKNTNTILFHISTDFVFDGTSRLPYTENDTTHPINVYGETKLLGENAVLQTWEKSYIIRTSWIFSQYGKNFLKTMLQLAADKKTVSIVDDQIGTPTYAIDLVKAIVHIIMLKVKGRVLDNFGLYNFSNSGQCSWYAFAKEIFYVFGLKTAAIPIRGSDYPTAAKRPSFSVLDIGKIKKEFGIEIRSWQKALIEIRENKHI